MKFTQVFSAIAFLLASSSAVAITHPIAARDDGAVEVLKPVNQPVINQADNSVISGLESIIPSIVSTVLGALGEPEDKASSVIPDLLNNLGLGSLDPNSLVQAAQNGTATADPLAVIGSVLGFIPKIITEIFKILGTTGSTVISVIPGVITTLIKMFKLTVPDIISLFTGLFSGNIFSLGNIVLIAKDVFQDIELGFGEAFSIIQQIISNLSSAV